MRKLCHFRLPPDLHRALKVRAARDDTTVTALVERALVAFLRRPPRKER
jgi:predicted HicB family RNase H-like nuclease